MGPAAADARPVHSPERAQPPLQRQGSLHEGGDVWYSDVLGSDSDSDDSLAMAGVPEVHRHQGPGQEAGAGGEPRGSRPSPPQKAVLDELMQRLQLHLAGPPLDPQPSPPPRVSAA